MGTLKDKDILGGLIEEGDGGGGHILGGDNGGGGGGISIMTSGNGGGGGGGCTDIASGSSGGGGPIALLTLSPPPPLAARPTPPPFLMNLYKMVDDKALDPIISWGPLRSSFIINDEKRFVSDVLPRFSKSIRFNSFTTQLKNYGFKKVNWNRVEFEHEFFQEGKQHLLINIKRKNQQTKCNNKQENNQKSRVVASDELQYTFVEVKERYEETKKKHESFKNRVDETFSEVQEIVMDMANELISTFGEMGIGKKRNFNDMSIDFYDLDLKDFRSICESFELPDQVMSEGEPQMNQSADIMALRDFVKNQNDLGSSYIEMRNKQSSEFANFGHKSKTYGRGGGRGGRVPPFLHKLYDMVEKQETDGLISWRLPYRNSFIIWDINQFATNVLPIYFNHTNFSSFNSQLNTYGFKKISWELHEYANEWFMGGRTDLLSNMKRRHQVRRTVDFPMTSSSIEVELLKNELKNIQENQENKILWFSNYKEQTENSLQSSKEMTILMANIFKKMIQKCEEINGNVKNLKKNKLNPPQIIEDNHVTGDELGDKAIVEPEALFQDFKINNEMLMALEDNIWINGIDAEKEFGNYLSLIHNKPLD